MTVATIDKPKPARRKSTERTPRAIKLTASDADIIRHVAKHRFLRSPGIGIEVAAFSWTVCRVAGYGSVRAACFSAS